MATTTIADYDCKRVIQTFGDITPTMYHTGSRVTITQSAENFSLDQGMDGHGVRNKNHAVHAMLSFSLMASDPANEKLADLLKQDIEGDDGEGIVKYQCTDNNGTGKVTAQHAWITKVPDFRKNAAHEPVEWTVLLHGVDNQTGALKLL